MSDNDTEGGSETMGSEGIEPGGTYVVRPRRMLVVQSVIAALALLVPLFVVAYWLTVARGTWLPVAIVDVIVTAVGVYAIDGGRRMHVTLTAEQLTKRYLFGRLTTWRRADIASVIYVDLYQSGTVETLPSLYLLNARGELILRLRGQIWPQSGIERLADTLGVIIVRPPEPLTLAELRSLQPTLAPTYIRRTLRQRTHIS